MILKKSLQVPEEDVVESQEIRENKREILRRKRVDAYVWKKNKNGTPILVERGVDARDLPDDYECFSRDALTYQIIADAITGGSNFTEISRKPGMPPLRTIYNWLERDPKFKAMIDLAKKQRADRFHDEVQHVAKNVKEKNSKSSKVKIDAYKYLMEVGDREQYGSQTKVVGDPNAPVQFIVNTGIKRKTIDAEGGTIAEKHDGKVLREDIPGADERLLAVDGGAKQEGIRPNQDVREASDSPSSGIPGVNWSNSGEDDGSS